MCKHKQALKAIFMSRRHVAAEAEGNKPVSVGYPPNAAMAALNKHAVDFLNPRELMVSYLNSLTYHKRTDVRDSSTFAYS